MVLTGLAVLASLWAVGAGSADGAGPQPAGSKPEGFFQVVEAHFDRWDANRDGKLSGDELDRLACDPKLAGAAAAAVAVLKAAASSRKVPFGDITRPRLAEHSTWDARQRKERGAADLAGRYRQTLAKLAGTDRRLFGNDDRPVLDGCRQGRLGDCFLLAPIGAAVFHDAARVKDLFREQPGGGWKVAFPGGAVAVPPLSDTALAMTGTTRGHGIWLNVLEDAYARHRNAGVAAKDRKAADIDAIRFGGTSRPVIELLTGHVAKRISWTPVAADAALPQLVAERLAEIRAVVPPALAAKRLVVAGTPAGAAKVPGLTPNHAYAVLGYDAQADALLLWNPHANSHTPKGPAGLAHGYPTKAGRFAIPLADLARCFRGVSYETAQPLPVK